MPLLETEQELLAKAMASDPIALERLLLLHYNALLQHVSARLPAALQGLVSPEDVLQETLVQAFRSIARFEPLGEGAFSGWLRSIADHQLSDVLKGQARKKRGGGRRRAAAPIANCGSSLVDLAEWLAADASTPSRSAERDEAAQAVRVAMAGLPPDYRRAVRLRYFEGRTVDETAQLMRRSPGAIRGLIDRAKEKLRAAIGRASQYLSSR